MSSRSAFDYETKLLSIYKSKTNDNKTNKTNDNKTKLTTNNCRFCFFFVWHASK